MNEAEKLQTKHKEGKIIERKKTTTGGQLVCSTFLYFGIKIVKQCKFEP